MNLFKKIFSRKEQPIKTQKSSDMLLVQGRLSRRMRQQRNNKDLSQRDLATQLRVSRQAISEWERGKSFPSAVNLVKLCKILDMDINEFY